MRRTQYLKHALWLMLLLSALPLIISPGTDVEGSAMVPAQTVVPAYEGYHDFVDCNWVAGWVWDKNNQGTRFNVSVFDDTTGALIAAGMADQFRQDLVSTNKGDGKYAFFIPMPAEMKDGQNHNLRVTITNTSFSLGFTPKSFSSTTLSCPAPVPPSSAGPIRMTILTRPSGSKDRNLRVQAANQSVSYTPASPGQPAKYHVYGDAGFDTWRWNSTNSGFEGFYNTVYPIGSSISDCAYGTDPRLWKPKCTSDSLGYFWKQVACPVGATRVACEDNDRWNASPGTYNITTFTSPSVWPNSNNEVFGTKGYATVIDAAKINRVSIQPSAGNCHPYADTVWADDILPSGAVQQGVNENWKWAYASPAPSYPPPDDPNSAPKPSPTPLSIADPVFPPPPFPSWISHQSGRVSGLHQHLFTGASYPLKVNAGDSVFVFIYLDPNSLPQEVMVQWYEPASGWEHRAYWGANKIAWGTDGTTSRRSMGGLPTTGQWVRLEVPAYRVGLEGRTITGIAFTLFDGQATWDRAGKSTPVSSNNCPPKMALTPEQSFHAYNPDEFATGADYPAVQQIKYANGSSRWFMAFNRMVKYVTTTYSVANPNFPGPGQSPTIPYNDSVYGQSWGDNWQVMWATSTDGANWTIQPKCCCARLARDREPGSECSCRT